MDYYIISYDNNLPCYLREDKVLHYHHIKLSSHDRYEFDLPNIIFRVFTKDEIKHATPSRTCSEDDMCVYNINATNMFKTFSDVWFEKKCKIYNRVPMKQFMIDN